MHVHHDHNYETQDHSTCCGYTKGGAGHEVVNPHKDNAHKALLWTGLLAGGSHIFCCVLPGIFSVLALLSGFGIIITLPGWLEHLHGSMHAWEVPIITFSGVIVVIGWVAYFYSKNNDCHAHGCDHSSCQPRKKRAGRILILASVLFVVNVAVYVGLHSQHAPAEDAHAHDEHAHDH
jgi:hypothetical protein